MKNTPTNKEDEMILSEKFEVLVEIGKKMIGTENEVQTGPHLRRPGFLGGF